MSLPFIKYEHKGFSFADPPENLRDYSPTDLETYRSRTIDYNTANGFLQALVIKVFESSDSPLPYHTTENNHYGISIDTRIGAIDVGHTFFSARKGRLLSVQYHSGGVVTADSFVRPGKWKCDLIDALGLVPFTGKDHPDELISHYTAAHAYIRDLLPFNPQDLLSSR